MRTPSRLWLPLLLIALSSIARPAAQPAVAAAVPSATNAAETRTTAPAPVPPATAAATRTYYELRPNPTRIIYIVDASKSQADRFPQAKREVTRVVGAMLPIMDFAVVVFSDTKEQPRVLTPGNELQRATTEAKRDFADAMERVSPKGDCDGQLEPFLGAFKTALAMKPQIVYFFDNTRFSPELTDAVKKLNADHAVRIYAITLSDSKELQDQLRALAKANGGAFKFVREDDLKKSPGTVPSGPPPQSR